ncbi:MAG: hypothetical protein DME02_23505 [Candidatus Rokuibacteriota bacterium]|jgi:hypothetical protein|nr:MAG: hypothetical protein DME02_23505 [Candidatus Rokubacteria bacterium]PYO21518.1 MAG: hypothetical protein DMD85_13860 [Candidatus Rokubacteria bacterium]
MWKLWIATLAVALIVCGCSTVHKKPVEIDMPVAERHFIVMDGISGAETRRPHPQEAARAVVVDPCEAAETS